MSSSSSSNTSQKNLKQIIQNLESKLKSQYHVKDVDDFVVLLFHELMLEEGFRCIGLMEEDSVQDYSRNELPNNWNQQQGFYSFKYRHHQSSFTFILKCIKLGKDQFIVHAMANEDESTRVQFEINSKDFVKRDAFQNFLNTDSGLEASIVDADKLEALFKINITRRLVPFLNKEGYEQEAPTTTTTTTNTNNPPQQSQPQSQPQRPQRIIQDEDDDPLRIGPVRRPPPMSNPNDFGYSDLYPNVPPMMIGGGNRNQFGGFSGGGNLMGRDQLRNMFGQPQRSGLPQGVPEGARFDPYGPMVPPPTRPNRPPNTSGDPNPDHERVPRNLGSDTDRDFNPYFF